MVFQWFWSLIDTTSTLLIIFTILMMILYNFLLKNWWYFSKRNVKFIRGWPFIGSLHEFFFGDKSFGEAVLSFYRRFPDEPFIGVYEFTHPVYIVRDPELIKKITVQDFEHFLNHQGSFDVSGDTLMAKTLFFSRDQQWKEMRNILSPAFTGNKMRLMFDLIRECTTDFCDALHKIYEPNSEDSSQGFEIETKDLLSRFATNIIATCAFGLKVDAISEQNNEFYLSGKIITNFDGIQGVKLLLLDVIPRVMKLLRIQFIEKRLCDYFRNVVKTAMVYREQNDIYRPDMIHLLMQARKGTLVSDDDEHENRPKKTSECNFNFLANAEIYWIYIIIVFLVADWEDDDLVAQCVLFFFAGFETTSTLLSFMCHELAMNPQIQEKLYNEIARIEREQNGKPITYDTIQKFKYMDMVVSETLRLWPPVPGTDRQVAKPYRIETDDGRKVELTTYDVIWIPIFGIHLDEKYWKDAKCFDPERFNDENRNNIRVGTYLPFGSGQRACIASRFALMVAKTLFYFILQKYRIEQCSKTPNPMVLKPNSVNFHAKDGFWVRFQPRN